MKLKDAVRLVDRSEENSTHADIDEFSRAVNADVYIGWSGVWNSRVKGYWLIRWMCTDTWVGKRVYFLDDKPVAVSMQTARKNDEYIEFLDKESAESIREFIFELNEVDTPSFPIVDQEEELDEFYNFDLTDYFLESEGFVDGKPVKIINREWWPEPEKRGYVCYHCKVEFEDGTQEVVEAEKVLFPLRVVFNV